MRRAPVLLAAIALVAAAGLVLALREDRLLAVNGSPAPAIGPTARADSPRADSPRADSPRADSPRADSLALALIAGIRGLDPVACELAARTVRSRSWGGGPAEPMATDDPRVVAVVRWATDAGGVEAVPILAMAMADADPCVRRVAAIRIGRIEDPAAMARLRAVLGGSEPDQREAAALGLGIAQDRSAVPALVRTLESDRSARARRAAAWALGEME